MQKNRYTPASMAPIAAAVAVMCALATTPALAMTDAERAFLSEQENVQRELLSLQMQVRVLEQRAKVGDLERKIRDANAPPAPAPSAQNPFMGMPGMPGGFPMMQGGPPIDLRNLPPMAGGPGMPGMPAAEPEMTLLSVFGFRGQFNADMRVGERTVRVAVGDVVGGAAGESWRVSAIEPNRITLTQVLPERAPGAAPRGARQPAARAPQTRVIGL